MSAFESIQPLVTSPKGVIPSAAVLQAERGACPERSRRDLARTKIQVLGLEQEISNSEFVWVRVYDPDRPSTARLLSPRQNPPASSTVKPIARTYPALAR